MKIKEIMFNEDTYGTPNPDWTKSKVGKFGNNIEKLAKHICTRTPPGQMLTKTNVFICIVNRNQKALGTWSNGYKILTDRVWELLNLRGDNTLWGD